MKEILIKILKQPLIYILVICIFFQFKIYDTVQESRVTIDGVTYMECAKNTSILHGEVDAKRTPVYPYFIKIILKICGEENLDKNIVKAQKYLFIITLLLFYACVNSITKNRFIISILTLIFGISPFVILWNITVLTEAISILEITFLSLLTIQYLKKPRYILSGSIGITILIMIMTRPSFIYLLPIYILFWILRFFFEKENRKKAIIGGLSCIICAIILLGYCMLMKQQYGEFALTTISDLNNVVSVIKSKAYKNASNEEMIKVTDEAFQQEKNMWEIYDILSSKFNKEELREFASSSIKTSDYLKYLMKKTVQLGTKNIGINYVENTHLLDGSDNYIISYQDIGETTLPITFGFIYFLIIISIIYLIWKLIKTKQINWMVAFFTSLIFANIFTLIVGAPEEEQRLFSSSIVLVLLFITYIIEKIIKRGKNNEKMVI